MKLRYKVWKGLSCLTSIHKTIIIEGGNKVKVQDVKTITVQGQAHGMEDKFATAITKKGDGRGNEPQMKGEESTVNTHSWPALRGSSGTYSPIWGVGARGPLLQDVGGPPPAC